MDSTIYKRKSPLLLFLLPSFAFMTLFLYYPFIMNILNSCKQIMGLGTAATGWNDPWYTNYVRLFQDEHMGTALINTLWMMAGTIVFQVGIALILALMVDNITKGAQFFRTVYFFPIVISATALGLMFTMIFTMRGGVLNELLLALKVIAEPINWKDEEHYKLMFFAPVMWQYVGFYFVIIITGLNNISGDLYEAASIDGASGLQRIRFLTLPLLHNTLCTCLTLAITGALKVFDLPWVILGRGVPANKSWLTATYMYDQTFNAGDVDYASTIALVIVILGVVISQIANAIFKEKDY